MKTPYQFIKRKAKPYIQVSFRHIPGRWFSTGTTSMAEAVKFAENELRKGGLGKTSTMPTLEAFAHDMFTPTDPYGIKRRNEARNLHYSAAYYEQHQGRLENHIIPKFGKHLLDSITDVAIEDWLLDLHKSDDKKLPLSDDSRNKVLICFRLVLQEAKRQGYIDKNPAEQVRMINARNKPRKTITKGELALLFPPDAQELNRIWLSPMWAAYFLVLRDTGFRPGEVAALQKRHYFPALHGLYTEQSVSFRTRKVKDSIKTTDSGQKYKVGLLTEQTCLLLDELSRDMQDRDFFFTVKGRLLRPEISNKHLKASCKRANVDLGERTQYSFRHAFETGLAGKVENKVLLELMAHTAFHPEYDHRGPEHVLAQLQPVRKILEDRT